MHSPKFPGKIVHLRKVVSAHNLQKLWTKTVRNHMRTQLVPDAVEFLDFHIQLKQRCAELENLVCSGEYAPRTIIRLKAEKSKGLCRQIALPAPEDALLLQALSDALWQEIRTKAPSSNAFYAPQDQAFSKKNPVDQEDEWGYGPIESWLDFQKTILNFSQNRNFVVVTDIANYYDFILHNFLRSILADYAHEKEHALDLLIFLIDSMLWRPDYMPNYGIGLPQMHLDAPRLLAHTHLFEIDAIFSADLDIDFARYMDDMDFGVDSIAKAKLVLRDLDLALQTRNLRLNSGKTKILTAVEAQWHFRAEDNARLDLLRGRIEANSSNPARMAVYRRLVKRAIDGGLRKDRFEGGNGDKILKRLLTMAWLIEAEMTPFSFRRILYNKPGLRSQMLRQWSRGSSFMTSLPIISGFLRSGEAVDDLSRLLIAIAMVEAPISVPIPTADWLFLLKSFLRTNPFELFCRLWLISRFGTQAELKDEIESTRAVWTRHRFLSRTVAGFFSLFYGTPGFGWFLPYVRKWGGPNAASVLDFFEQVVASKQGFYGARPFVKAPNTSLPNQISHSKALILAAMLWNKNVPKIDRAKLLGIHAPMMRDIHYQKQFSDIISAAP